MKIDVNGQIVTDNIGELYSMFGISTAYPKKIKQALADADGEDITVEINSQGGLVTAGYEMYNALRDYKGKVTANVVFAASAATIVACAADKTYISEAGMFMIHNCSASGEGDYRDFEAQTEALKQFNDGILNVYEAKTGKTREELQALMDKETYMGPEKAIELGFVDGYINRDGKTYQKPTNKITDSQRMTQFVASASDVSNLISDADATKILTLLRAKEQSTETVSDEGHAADSTEGIEKGNGPVSIDNKVNKPKGGNSMTLEEVLSEHPEIQSDIDDKVANARAEGVKQGAEEERARMKSLDAIADTVPSEMLNEAKYGENPVDGKDLAYQALVNGQQSAKDYMKNAVNDSEDSGVNNVGVGNADAGEEVNDAEKDADFLANYVNAQKGDTANE